MRSAIFLFLPFLAAQDAADPRTGDAVRLELPGERALELTAHWEPFTDSVYGFGERYELVQELAPAAEQARYETAAFRPLLPPEPVRVGDTWRVDPVDLLPFLHQLHPGATERLHHGWHGDRQIRGFAAPGAWAVLRTLGPDRAEVLVRAHVDFLLEGDGGHGSSWLTPAQFEGRLLVDREAGVVQAFSLSLPDQGANVDFNIAAGDHGVVDIGRIPRMEVLGGEALAGPAPDALSALSDADAREALARRFYEFEKLDWYELGPALALAQETGKPLHVVLLFGSLGDESC